MTRQERAGSNGVSVALDKTLKFRQDSWFRVAHDTWSTDAWKSTPFTGFRDLLNAFESFEDWPSLVDLEQRWLRAQDVRTHMGIPMGLMAQPAKLRRARPRNISQLYDVALCEGQLPTRSHNWHDFFNVMMFVAFPNSKRLLHARQRRILEQLLPNQIDRLPGRRTVEQDCLTILDEGAVLLAVDDDVAPHVESLLDRGEHRELAVCVQANLLRPWLLGHAHAEQVAKRTTLSQGISLSRARPVVLAIGAGASRSQVDAALGRMLSGPDFCTTRDPRRAVALTDLYLDLATPDS